MEGRQLSLSEVAGVMGVSERTVRRWIKSGTLKAYKPGRDYRIPESGLREFIEESEVAPKGLSPSTLPEEAAEAGLEESFDDLDAESLAALAGELEAEFERIRKSKAEDVKQERLAEVRERRDKVFVAFSRAIHRPGFPNESEIHTKLRKRKRQALRQDDASEAG